MLSDISLAERLGGRGRLIALGHGKALELRRIIKTAENFIQSRLPVLNASLWTALEGWQTSGTGASGILLSDIFEPGKRKWLSVGGLSTDFFRHLDHNNQSI